MGIMNSNAVPGRCPKTRNLNILNMKYYLRFIRCYAIGYFQHDDRDAPPGQQQRRPRQSMPSSGRRWSPPEPRGRLRERGARFRRHSSDERVWRRDRDRGGGERERDRYVRLLNHGLK